MFINLIKVTNYMDFYFYCINKISTSFMLYKYESFTQYNLWKEIQKKYKINLLTNI